MNESRFVKRRRSSFLQFDKLPENLRNTCFKNDIKHHRYIHLRIIDKALLMFHYYLPCLIKISCWSKKLILTRMLHRAEKRVYKNLNVFKISTRLNEIMLFQQFQQVLDSRSRWLLKHSAMNIINCDSEYLDTSDSLDNDNCAHNMVSSSHKYTK